MKNNKTIWFRTNPEYGNAVKSIDRDNKIIYGVSVCTEGEAKGHGYFLDNEFIDNVIKFGNSWKTGVKSRFGHPSMSAESLGTTVGRFKSFRKNEKGNQAIADIHFFKDVKGANDHIEYIMDLAEEDPKSFATSIVFNFGKEYKKDKNGNKIYENAKEFDRSQSDIFVEIEKLIAVDFVDEPAANPNGLFSYDNLAAKAWNFLQENPEIQVILQKNPEKLFKYITKFNYLNNNNEGDNNMAEINGQMNAELEQLKLDSAANEKSLKAQIEAEKLKSIEAQNKIIEFEKATKENLINSLVKNLPETKLEEVKIKLSKLSIESINELGSDIVKANDTRPQIPNIGDNVLASVPGNSEKEMTIAEFADMQYKIQYSNKGE